MIVTLKNIFILASSIFLVQCSLAQPGILDKKSEKLFEKAKTAYQNRDDQGAMNLLMDVIDRSPKFPDAHMLKFQIHQEASDFENAKKELETVVNISPDFFKNAHLFLGRIYLSEGNYQASLERLEYFASYQNLSQNLYDEALSHTMTCKFAIEAMENPVPFDPKSMGEGVNSEFSEYFPSLTGNDKTILFTRRVKKLNSEQEQEDFYISEKVNGVWSDALPMKFINTPMNEGAPSIAPDGELIVFTACENVYGEYGGDRRGLGSCDLFYSFREGDSWTKPRNIGAEINSRNWETQPSLSADGRTIYFVRGIKKKEGLKNLDIYISSLGDDGVWTTAERMSDVINTPKDESSVLIHPDGRTLYFTSNGHLGMGGEDVFLSRIDKNGEWSLPVNLGYPINTFNNENSLVVSTSGELAYFASDRTGGMGGMDLYQFELYPKARPDVVNYMEGFVYDSSTKAPMQALFQLIDLKTEEIIIESYSNSIDGKFLVTLP
ncbi:MAG: Tol biopolymer transport system component, partial [Urechidicola sp.]